MPLDPLLARTLETLAPTLSACRRPWWVIGSGAAALHGAPVAVADVDILADPADAPALLSCWGAVAEVRPSGLFRSEVFARWDAPPLPVELMCGLEVRLGLSWVPVRPETREVVEVQGCRLFMPAVAELRAIMRLFGRPKDLEREALLAASASSSPAPAAPCPTASAD